MCRVGKIGESYYGLQEKDSNPRPPGYGPGELPDCSILLYRRVSPASMRIKGGSSRRLNAFGFMVHYNILKRDIQDK